MESTTTVRPPSKSLLDLEITILSAKHLQNVNWRNGNIKPYVVFWLDSDRRVATKPDQSGSTKPVWNETFTLPINLPLHEALLSIEILHSKPSETPNPLIGSVRIDLKDLKDGTLVGKFDLQRPSGRPQGKISLKLAISQRDLPDYAPPNPYYYSTAPPPPARDFRQYPQSPYSSPFPPPPSAAHAPAPAPYYGSYSEPYPGYFSGYYQQPPPPPPPVRSYFDRPSSYGSPSAPLDYAVYDQRQRGSGKFGVGSGAAVGAAAGAMGGLTLDEGVKYDEDKFGADRVESDLPSRDGYSHYRIEH